MQCYEVLCCYAVVCCGIAVVCCGAASVVYGVVWCGVVLWCGMACTHRHVLCFLRMITSFVLRGVMVFRTVQLRPLTKGQ